MRTLVCALALSLLPASAGADETAPPPPPSPPPYSLPWLLRPVIPASVVRGDTTVATFTDAGGHRGTTVVDMLLISYRIKPWVAPLVRLGVVDTWSPTQAPHTSGFSFVNPVLGANFGFKLPVDLRLSLALLVALPIGTGGGNTPLLASAAANRAGLVARSAMDNAMFAVNDFVFIGGADLAWIHGGFTAQLEVTVLQLIRARGELVQLDGAKTNFTTGLHLGYFPIPQLALSAELRYQIWLSTPNFVALDKTGTQRDTVTVAIGARGNFHLGKTVWLRPGVSVSTGLRGVAEAGHYFIVQFDVPLAF